jgi:hypothetical protein
MSKKFSERAKEARSRRSQQLQQRQLLGERDRPCPTPDKAAFASRRVAKQVRNRFPAERLAIYRCVCGTYHLGRSHVSREQARLAAEAKLQ